MKRLIKYGIFPVGIFFLLLIITLTLLPTLINVQKYIPEIERQIARASGRSFSLGPDLNVSLFPWISISLSDLHLGNPEGFINDDFIKIRTFEARLKVLPLLRKKVQISRFVVDGLSVNLERSPSGRGNWLFAGGKDGDKEDGAAAPWSLALLSEKLSFDLFAVTDGQVRWSDGDNKGKYQVEDIMLLVNDFKEKQPFSLDCKITLNGKQVAMEGKVGPVSEQVHQGAVPVDLRFEAMKIRGQVHGLLVLHGKSKDFELFVKVASFSPRELFAVHEQPFPFVTQDPTTFGSTALEFTARGDKGKIYIEKGVALIDASRLNFSLSHELANTIQTNVSLDLDRVDLLRYLPVAEAENKEIKESPIAVEQKKAVAGFLQGIALAGDIRVGALQVYGGTLSDLHLPINGKDGLFTMAPFSFKASQGQVEGSLIFDLQGASPALQTNLKAQGLDAAVLSREYFDKEYLRGSLTVETALQCAGDSFAEMVKNLDGKASLDVRDGAVVGIEIPKMAGAPGDNGAASSNNPQEAVWTSFAEAKSDVSISKGMVHISEASLLAPNYQMRVSGFADIASQRLDMQIENTFVTTRVLKQGHEEKVNQSVLAVISGSFSEPEMKRLTVPMGSASTENKLNVKHLVEHKLSLPPEDDVKNLVGKDLVDPAVVALRFRLQPEILLRSEQKKKIPLGTGRIRIGALRQEQTLN